VRRSRHETTLASTPLCFGNSLLPLRDLPDSLDGCLCTKECCRNADKAVSTASESAVGKFYRSLATWCVRLSPQLPVCYNALARLRFPGRSALFLLLVTGYAIPLQTVLVPLYELLREARLLNNYLGLILPYVAFGVPFSIFLLYAFFLDFPKEIEEAARLDGCTELQILWRVVMPLSLPALASVAIFQGVAIWNEFVLALIIINSDRLKTLPLGLQTFQGQYATDWPNLLAAVVMATLPILLLYVILQRQFIRSLAGFAK
jgi:ABC-type glycerol-3-phosphate transport system permease component